MSGIASIAIGRRKTGKTTFTKTLLESRPKNMPVIVYDVNREYASYYNEPFTDFRKFLDKVVNLKGCYIIFEEATIFFDTRSNFEEMKNLLVRARHTKNIIQLNFHSFASVPRGIYNLLDYVTIFKTNDNVKNVKDRFDNPKVLRAFENAINSKNEFYSETVSLY